MDPEGKDSKTNLGALLIKFLKGTNVVSPVPLELLNPQPYVRQLLKVNPITGAFVTVLFSPTTLQDPYLGDDGKWYWPDGTPVETPQTNDSPCE
ncbi:MAG: hypothetical protein SVW57_13960 [Thermodesulfobacteriota bacterium]|nr:hypothetical protein [Thermodesulfobacteriota bacterium]